MNEFDTMLWRPLHSGLEYDALFPPSKCNSKFVGKGNTDLSISEMEKVIENHAWQTEKIAQKLQKSNLQATVQIIHSFLFNYFQYKADDENQMLRSPACSWYTRNTGIDCKSYSVLASCILLNLKITHYIRKIKQPGYAPNDFTHVYVVVPKNQKTGSLNDGYYVIDGTLKSNIEPAFIGKKDLKMEGLNHYALNGSFENQGTNEHGLGIGFSDVKTFVSKFSFNNVKSIISKIGCLGWNGKENSALTEDQLLYDMGLIDRFFKELFEQMNDAAEAKNYTEFSRLANKYVGYSEVMFIGAKLKRTEGYNSCTGARQDVLIKQTEFYSVQIGVLFNAWLAKYFVVSFGTTKSVLFQNNLIPIAQGIAWVATNDWQKINKTIINYVPKANTSIPDFILNQYVDTQATEGLPIDTNEFLKILETTGSFIQLAQNNGNGNNPPPNPNPWTPNPPNPAPNPNTQQPFNPNAGSGESPKPSTMGGYVIGGVIALVGLSLILKKSN